MAKDRKKREKPPGWKVPWEPYTEASMRVVRGVLARDNRQAEYDAMLQKVMEEFQCSMAEAIPEASRRMKLLGTFNPVDHAAKRAAEKAAFDKAFASLPDTANPKVEWDWIASHPALMRHDRPLRSSTRRGPKPKDDGASKPIRITVKDILDSPNGPAPSKRAVTQLHVAMKDPTAFWKELRSAHKKQQEEGSDERAAAKDPGIEEVRRLLNEFTGDFLGV